MNICIELRDVTKDYGSTRALESLSVSFKAGDIHALVGPNAAGKSTIIKIIAGDIEPSDGVVIRQGKCIAVHQDYHFIEDLTILDNLLLGFEEELFDFGHRDKKTIKNQIDLVFGGSPSFKLSDSPKFLTQIEKKLLQIVRALLHSPQILLLDEPSASLPKDDRDRIFGILKNLQESGVTIIYVTHYIDELFALANSFSVIVDGKCICTDSVRNVTTQDVLNLINQNAAIENEPSVAAPNGVQDERENIGCLQFENGRTFEQTSFEIKRGVILGLYANASTDLANLLRQAHGLESSILAPMWKNVHILSAQKADVKTMLLSGDRTGESVAANMPILDNLTLPALKRFSHLGVINAIMEAKQARATLKDLNVVFDKLVENASTLSGGNQQKIALGRSLLIDCDLLLLDDPVKGIDSASRQQVFEAIRHAVYGGMSVIVFSSFLDDLIELVDAGYVFFGNKVSCEVLDFGGSRNEIMAAATTGRDHGVVRFA